MPFTMPWAYVMRAGLGFGSESAAIARCVLGVLVVLEGNSFAVWEVDVLLE
jgi:hypothetical protein